MSTVQFMCRVQPSSKSEQQRSGNLSIGDVCRLRHDVVGTGIGSGTRDASERRHRWYYCQYRPDQPGDSTAPNTRTTSSGTVVAQVPAKLAEQQGRWNGRTFQVLSDTQFRHGILLRPTTHTGTNGGDVLFATDTSEEPYWLMPQWYSRKSLTGAKPTVKGNATTYANDCKSATLTRYGGSRTPSLTLVCNGYAEYGAKPSADSYGWVHFGAEQNLRDLVKLGDLESFVLDMNARLDYKDDKSGGSSADTYPCQINICFIVRNDNAESEDYGKIIWVQVGLYDERYDYPPEYCGIDAGIAESSGEFIYTMAAKNILKEPFGSGNKAEIHYDWLPIFRQALQKVQAAGGMPNTNFSDLKPTSFSFGYELKRGANYSVTMEDISVKATYTQAAHKNMIPQAGKSYDKGFTVPNDWYVSGGDWKFDNGVVTQERNKLTAYRMSLKGQYYTGNYDIEYEMRLNERYSTTDAWAGISFSKAFMDDDHGLSGEILFSYPSGHTILGKFQAKQPNSVVEADIANYKLKDWYRYKIEVRGNKGTVYVNDKKLMELDSSYIGEGGYISVISCLGRCSFRNFKVTVK